MDSKRVRCSNFTNSEMEALLMLVEEHKRVIECKKTDTVSNRQKDLEWDKLAQKYNALVGSGRTTKQLRMKWDAWKKATRKRVSLKKCSLYSTGGGPGDSSSISNWDDRILGIIGISATGVDNIFDSDSTIGEVLSRFQFV